MVENIYVYTSAYMCEMTTDEKRRLVFVGEQEEEGIWACLEAGKGEV